MNQNMRARKRWWIVDIGIVLLCFLSVPVLFVTLAGPLVLLERFGSQWFPAFVARVGDDPIAIGLVAILSIVLAARLWFLLVEYAEGGWRSLTPLGRFFKLAVP